MRPGTTPRCYSELVGVCATLALIFAATIQLTACGTPSQISPQAAEKAQSQSLLPDSADQIIRKHSFDIKKESGPGLAYLEKSGLNLIIMLPSIEQLHAAMKAKFQKGEINADTMRSYDQMLKNTPPKERKEVKFIAVGPGFEPSTTLARPYGLQTQEGQALHVSEKFMQRFQITTEYDLMRIIRNSSIILSNFAGPDDQDYFDPHYQRLLQVLDSQTALSAGPSSEARISSILEFTASLMVIDSLLAPTDIVLTTEEYYIAALVIGTEYKLF
ncbi:MAG: hypothetical protein M0036_12020 [Desulfobacteraceae bacterium]|nr:hypothetical protein [Desulfobacteraceae bacterium]